MGVEPRKSLGDVDRGWAWLVLAATLLTQMIIGLLVYSLGVVQIILLETFDEGLLKTTLVLSFTSSLLCLPGPLFGILVNATSCRTAMLIGSTLIFIGCSASAFVENLDQMFVTLSLMTGIGVGMVYTPSMVIVGFYFDKYLGIGTAVAVTGGAIGMLAGPPLVGYLHSVFGWSGMFLMIGGISANILVSSMVCRPSSIEKSHWVHPNSSDSLNHPPEKASADEATQPKEPRWKAAIRTSAKVIGSLPMFLFCSSILLWSVCISIVNLYLPSYVVDHGASTEQSSLVFTVMGICNIVSRLLGGVFVGFLDKFFLYSISFAVMAFLTTGFPFLPANLAISLAFSGLFGLCTGGPYVVLTAMTKDLVGLAHLATAFGLEMMVSGIGMLVGPPVAGLLAESSGSYTSSFIFAGITCGFSSLLGFVLKKCKKSTDQLEVEIEDPDSGILAGSRPSSVLFPSQLSIPGVPSPYLEIRSKSKNLVPSHIWSQSRSRQIST